LLQTGRIKKHNIGHYARNTAELQDIDNYYIILVSYKKGRFAFVKLAQINPGEILTDLIDSSRTPLYDECLKFSRRF
ncbi:MAG: hypothetical protein KJO34_19270, partial [Deltaproteobacteria bacterium]|nr:hypothetical protein [Deltaproteobacteria bacterium]